MSNRATTTCPNCERLQNRLDELQRLVDGLRATVAQLQLDLATARKDSSSSSKPPSSDIVKPPKPPLPPDTAKRSAGGQPGHPKHEPPTLPCTTVRDHVLDLCPRCGGDVQPCEQPPRLTQTIEICAPPVEVVEHRAHACWCAHCQRVCYAPWPDDLQRGGRFGPTLTTLIAYLKGVCHASFSTIRRFCRDVLAVPISRSALVKVIQRVSAALATPYTELLEALPEQAYLNVDETGHKDNGQHLWTWCFRASLFTLYEIDPRRSADVLMETLGRDFDGILGCDYFSAYRRYMRECGVQVQFCLAHLIRDVKFLQRLPDQRDVAYAERLLGALRGVFGVIHQREQWSAEVFERALVTARDELLRVATTDVPATAASQCLARRFKVHGASYVRFVTTPGVEPTNNLAEQAIRFVVLDRVVTQGTRSVTGQCWCERIWTVIATCTQQGRSIYAYLSAAVKAFVAGEAVPSLLPSGA